MPWILRVILSRQLSCNHMNTSGNWNIILQTDRILQRVALDTCIKPGYPCTGIASCGKRSQCVQRFNHQVICFVSLIFKVCIFKRKKRLENMLPVFLIIIISHFFLHFPLYVAIRYNLLVLMYQSIISLRCKI